MAPGHLAELARGRIWSKHRLLTVICLGNQDEDIFSDLEQGYPPSDQGWGRYKQLSHGMSTLTLSDRNKPYSGFECMGR